MSSPRTCSNLSVQAAASALVAGALAIGLAGCVLQKPAGTAASTSPRHRDRLRSIVYVNPLPDDPLWDRIGTCMAAAAARHRISVRQVGPPGGNVDLQTLENLDSQAIATGAQAIVTWSQGAPGAFDALFAQARTQGSYVITLLSSGATRRQNVDIGTYPALFARRQVDAVAKRPGQQRLGVLAQAPTGAGYGAYVSGLKAAVAAHPKVKLVAINYDQGIFTNDVSLVSTMLTAHPTINVLINYSGFTGILTAIKENNDVGKVFAVISSDFPRAAEGYINQGLVAAVRVVPSCRIGQQVVQRLLDLTAGRTVPAHEDEGDQIVTGRGFEHMVAARQL